MCHTSSLKWEFLNMANPRKFTIPVTQSASKNIMLSYIILYYIILYYIILYIILYYIILYYILYYIYIYIYINDIPHRNGETM